MVDSFIQFLGITNPDTTITVVVVALIGSFTIVLAYKLLDFMLNLITALIGRNNVIKF